MKVDCKSEGNILEVKNGYRRPVHLCNQQSTKPTTLMAIACCVVGFFLLVHFSDFVFEILDFIVGTIGIAAIQFAPHIRAEAVQITSGIGPVAVNSTPGIRPPAVGIATSIGPVAILNAVL